MLHVARIMLLVDLFDYTATGNWSTFVFTSGVNRYTIEYLYGSRMHKVTSRTSITIEKARTESSNNLCDTNSSSQQNIVPSMDLDSWRKAISAPTRYRVGSASIHIKPRDMLIILVVLVGGLLLFLSIYRSKSFNLSQPVSAETQSFIYKQCYSGPYDTRYPLTQPKVKTNAKVYRIGTVTDLDHSSKITETLWRSYYLKGYLYVFDNKSFQIQFDATKITLHSSLAQEGRGMELSELITFNGQLMTVDDRTGVIYKLKDGEVIPWVILSDGNGDVSKGFKSEWATVKDRYLYVGGLGKEWTTPTGEVLNLNPQFIKRIGPDGSVTHIDWHKIYNRMRDAAGYHPPGYMIHESVVWSSVHKKWFFLPRRASNEMYNDVLDEKRATNTLIMFDEDFEKIEVVKPFGPESQTHGFSSFKFIPDTNDELILAIKSEEDSGKTASYAIVLDVKGNVLMEETFIGDHKFEGIEFI